MDLAAAVRQRRGGTNQREAEFGIAAELAGRGGHQRADLRAGHAGLDARGEPAIGGEGDVGRGLHQRDLGGRLDHAAAADDRIGADLARGGRETG